VATVTDHEQDCVQVHGQGGASRGKRQGRALAAILQPRRQHDHIAARGLAGGSRSRFAAAAGEITDFRVNLEPVGYLDLDFVMGMQGHVVSSRVLRNGGSPSPSPCQASQANRPFRSQLSRDQSAPLGTSIATP
jgi:hypothetical protein